MLVNHMLHVLELLLLHKIFGIGNVLLVSFVEFLSRDDFLSRARGLVFRFVHVLVDFDVTGRYGNILGISIIHLIIKFFCGFSL